jgi:hypothetical protein
MQADLIATKMDGSKKTGCPKAACIAESLYGASA